MNDELNLDRVIDMPVYRDVLAWDVFELGTLNWLLVVFSCPTSQIPSLCVCAAEADVDYLPMAKPVATNHLGIRRDCAIGLSDFGRLLVVLSEDRHLCCLIVTGGSVFEICEIGE